MPLKTTGSKIRMLRERREWSQIHLAKLVGINNSVLSRIEADKRNVEGDELKRFAEVFEVSTDYLLGREKLKDTGPGYLIRTNPDLAEEILREFDQLPEADQKYVADLIKRLKNPSN